MSGSTTVLGITTIVGGDTVDLVTHMSTGIAQQIENMLTGTANPAGRITLAFGTITADRGLTITANLNSAGVNFFPVDINITQSNFAAPSRLFRIREGANSLFEVQAVSGAQNGIIITPQPPGTDPGITVISSGVNESLKIDAKGTGQIKIGPTSTGNILLHNEVQRMQALVALGGGAGATLGTIGGSGPAAAAQNTWMRFIDSTSVACWVPVWK